MKLYESGIFSAILFESGKICDTKDHKCLFHCIYICQVPQKMFEQLVLQPCVQTIALDKTKKHA